MIPLIFVVVQNPYSTPQDFLGISFKTSFDYNFFVLGPIWVIQNAL